MIESKPTTTTNADATGDRLNGAAKNGTLPVPVEADEEYTYLFPYREPSSYSHVVDLIRQYVPSEVIVDLGAGAGTIGEPLQTMGFTYIGVEKHRGALRILGQRNFRNHAVDLADTEALRGILDTIPDMQAFCLIDVLEHLHEPATLLRFLSEYALAHHAPYLFISVPNIAHRDVALNLLRGQWNVTEYGLLDKTHVTYYTRQSLQALLRASGWELAARNDFKLDESDQYDPESLLHTDTLLGEMMRYASSLFNPDDDVNQFIWMLKPVRRSVSVETITGPTHEAITTHPLVSILIRTQGMRNELLTEALFAVFAQDSDDYEIVVCFHNPEDIDGILLQGVNDVISTAPVPLRRKIRVILCTGTGRSAPLNELFEGARGEYLTILDDDDLLFPRHVSTIAKGVKEYGIGPMFQTFAVQRMLEVRKEKVRSPEFGFTSRSVLEPMRQTATYPYTVQSIEMLWAKPFDPLKQQYANAVHVSCFIVPKRLIEQTHLRFRNDFEYGEDWQFWMEASQILRVVTLPEITGVQNVRTNGTNTVGNSDLQPEWISSHKKRFAVQEEHPLVLDGRTARLIHRLHLDETARKADAEHRFANLQGNLFDTQRHAANLQGVISDLQGVISELQKQAADSQKHTSDVQERSKREYTTLNDEYRKVEREYQTIREAYAQQATWAKTLERQLQSRRGGLLRAVARRLLRK